MRSAEPAGSASQHTFATGTLLAMIHTFCGAAQTIAPLVRDIGGDAACNTVLACAATLGKLGRDDIGPAGVTVLRASLPAPTGSEVLQHATEPPETIIVANRGPCPTCSEYV